MAMSHGPATEWKTDGSAKVKTRLGVILFVVYTLVYAGFIFINVTFPKLMKTDIGSLNLAIVYGFGLIVLAVILALVYNHVCTRAEENAEREELASGAGEEDEGE
jgi:uncharacterized membrane protein (DUF485 family)